MPVRFGRMAFRPRWCMAIGLALLCAAGIRSAAPPDPTSWSLGEWCAWRDEQIAHILSPTFNYEGQDWIYNVDVAARSHEAHDLIARCLAKDAAYFSGDPERAKALGHFIEFVEAQGRSATVDASGAPTNTLGLAMGDQQYADAVVGSVQIPPLLASQPFLQLMKTPAGYRQAVEMIDRQNQRLPEPDRWQTLLFESRFLKSADLATYGRLMVMVPDRARKADLWFNFAIVTPDMPQTTPVHAVSLVAVPLDKPSQCLILDFMRIADPSTDEIEWIPAVRRHTDPNDRCYDCHKSPVLPIEPEREFGFDRSGNLQSLATASTTRDFLNRLIAKYPKTSFLGADPASFGPCMAPPGPRSDEFIRGAAGEPLSSESVSHIRDQMRCASCHGSFGMLNFPSALTTSRDIHALRAKQSIAQTYVQNGWMPPNNTLTPVERRALWRCLSKEYYDPSSGTGTLVDWLRGGG